MKTTSIIIFLSLLTFLLNAQNEVGINTTTPDHHLDIKSNSTSEDGTLSLSNSDESYFLKLNSGHVSSTLPKIYWKAGSNLLLGDDELGFTERFRFQSNGRMGINVISPAGKLHIKENSTTTFPQLRLTEDESDFARIKMESSNHTNAFWDIAGKADGNADQARLNFYFSNPSTSGDRMTLTGDGKIGINEPIPNGKLHIKENSTQYFPHLRLTEDDSDFARIKMESRNHPNAFWDIAGKADSNADQARLNFFFGNPGGGDRMTIMGSGNIGIGTTSPSSKLDVNGKIEIGDDTGAPVAGAMRFNSTTNDFEGYNGTQWISLTGGGSHPGIGTYFNNSSVFNPSGTTFNKFGSDVAVSGDVAVVGESGNNRAYVYEKSSSGWVKVAELSPSDTDTIQIFGTSVAIDNDVIVVGCPQLHDWDYFGKVFVYEKPSGGWADMTETAKLSHTTAAPNDHFGQSVAIEDSTIVVGANGINKAYIFEKPSGGWVNMTETAQLSPSGLGGRFGGSVAISGTSVLIGSSKNNESGNNDEGKAFIYEKPGGGWVNTTETGQLTASDGDVGLLLGWSVSISNEYAVLSSRSNPVKAYLYEKPQTGWTSKTEDYHLATGESEYINDVVIRDDLVLFSTIAPSSGYPVVYRFDKPTSGWEDLTPSLLLRSLSEQISSSFGNAIDFDGNTIVVGDSGKDLMGNQDAGKVYFFDN